VDWCVREGGRQSSQPDPARLGRARVEHLDPAVQGRRRGSCSRRRCESPRSS
jgi:hypothetical protein